MVTLVNPKDLISLSADVNRLVPHKAMRIASGETMDVSMTIEEMQKILGAEKMDKEIYQDNETAGRRHLLLVK